MNLSEEQGLLVWRGAGERLYRLICSVIQPQKLFQMCKVCTVHHGSARARGPQGTAGARTAGTYGFETASLHHLYAIRPVTLPLNTTKSSLYCKCL